MNKFIKILAVLSCVVILMANAASYTIFSGANERLSVKICPPQGGEALRIRVKNHIPAELTMLGTATTVCFNSDSSYVVADNAAGFALMYLCMAPNCDFNYQYGSYLFGGHAEVDGSAISFSPDHEITNETFFTKEVLDGNCLDTTIGLSAGDLVNSGLPQFCGSGTVHLTCYSQYNGVYPNTNVVAGIGINAGWNEYHFQNSDICSAL